jgi:acetyl esterase
VLIEKNIPLSDFEKAQLEKIEGASRFAKLPLPLMRWFVLRNIESFRHPKDIVMPIIPDCAYEIEHTRVEVDGKPNKVGISVFIRKDANAQKKPLLFFIHGGGFLGGDSRMSEGLMRYLADKLDIVCASVDYNVAPEATHPTPLNDCARALHHVIALYDIDKTRVFLSGDSAGGHLSAVMSLKLQGENTLVPKGQILFYPVTDLDRVNGDSYRDKGAEYASMRKGIRLSQSVYVPDKSCRKHPYVSPINARFDKPQPDALLLIAERDGLRRDGLAYAEKLEKASGYTRCVLYKGAFHSFINDLFRSDIADDAAAEMLTFIRDRIV